MLRDARLGHGVGYYLVDLLEGLGLDVAFFHQAMQVRALQADLLGRLGNIALVLGQDAFDVFRVEVGEQPFPGFLDGPAEKLLLDGQQGGSRAVREDQVRDGQ